MNRKLTWFDRLMLSVTFAEANAAEPQLDGAGTKKRKPIAHKQEHTVGNKSGIIAKAHS